MVVHGSVQTEKPERPDKLVTIQAARKLLEQGLFCREWPTPCFLNACTATAALPNCDYQNAWQLSKYLTSVGLPKRYWDATFENADPQFKASPHTHYNDALTYVEEYKENIRKGINVILRGNFGKGKTYLSMCMANALIDRGVKPYITSSPLITSKLHSYREDRNGNLARFRKVLYSAEVLFIDEWFTQYNDPWSIAEIVSIFRERTNWERPTVVTTNLTIEAIKKLPSDYPEFKAVIDRLFDTPYNWSLTQKETYRTTEERFSKATDQPR